jgi:N-acetyl-gamma-glutamyl-phosphate reductase
MIRVGIYGVTGYAGYELLQILARHPQAEVVFAASESYAGQRLNQVYPGPFDLRLISPEEASLEQADVVFLCTPHGASAPLAQKVLAAGAKCVDLSADFRLRDPAVYAAWYEHTHPAPELLGEAVYGLTEVYRTQVAGARLVANPGCYPTSVLLPLYPLLRAGALTGERIIVDAASGVSGAGAKPTPKTHFVSVYENYSAYNVGHVHRHVPEMEQELALYGKKPLRLVFAPHLLPVSRGILSTIYIQARPELGAEDLLALWQQAYAGEPFIQILELGNLATLAHVVHSNRCALSLSSAGAPGEFILVSAIDNLVKGASGQAVQNMNVMFGLEETLGLLV